MFTTGLLLIIGLTPFTMSNVAKLKSVDFEIFGNVQGVCFRMYTEEQARSLGVKGWVQNSRRGTVTGQLQGPAEQVDTMKEWLRTVGSPSSRIDRAVFTNDKDINTTELKRFATRH